MSHDPLCPWLPFANQQDPYGLVERLACRCDLIAKVREDTAKRAREGVMLLPYEIEDDIVVVRDDVLALDRRGGKAMNHPFAALSAEPTADYRGTPTMQCPCGSDVLLIAAVFDEDERLPGMYVLDAMCWSCGALLTAPCPVDERLEID